MMKQDGLVSFVYSIAGTLGWFVTKIIVACQRDGGDGDSGVRQEVRPVLVAIWKLEMS